MSAAPSEHRTRRALVVRGGWEGHAPVQATDLFRPFLVEQGFEVRVEDSPAVYADAESMAELDVIVQCMTMSTIERNEFDGLRAAVEAGTGLAGWHGGIADSYRNTSDYLHLIGGRQIGLGLAMPGQHRAAAAVARPVRPPRPHAPSAGELAAHATFVAKLDDPIWLK